MSTRREKIPNRTTHIAVIGIGYVGLPLATALARARFRVTGVDLARPKVDAVNDGRTYLRDVAEDDLRAHVAAGRLSATSDYDALRKADAIFICVPTPYDAQRAPDLSFIVAASEGILPRLKADQLVILQSTTYPGTTEEVVLPILERSGLNVGEDFHLAFCPERIDPGNAHWTAYNTPKVVGGVTPQCTQVAADLLREMGAPVHPVSSPRAAEMAKLLENTYRSVNIALVNELALLSERMGIDFWEVIEAAETKPFGFQAFRPGPGVGGHCIPVDPYYLSWKAREYDYYTRFIELAGEVNQAMPYHVVELTGEALGAQGRPLRGSRLLVLGVAFKPNIDDARNTPAARIVELLLSRGAEVRYHDPYVPTFRVVIVSGHHNVDYGLVLRFASAVVDTCNATAGLVERGTDTPAASGLRQRVTRLGAPRSSSA